MGERGMHGPEGAHDFQNKRVEEARKDQQKRETSIREQVAQTQREDKEANERTLIRGELENVAADFMRLGRILQDRETRRLTPLVRGEDFPGLARAARLLPEAATTPEIRVEDIANALGSLRTLLESFGANRTGGVRDDAESLGALIGTLKQTREHVGRLGSVLAQSATPEVATVASRAHGLAEGLEKAWLFTARKREAVIRASGY